MLADNIRRRHTDIYFIHMSQLLHNEFFQLLSVFQPSFANMDYKKKGVEGNVLVQ